MFTQTKIKLKPRHICYQLRYPPIYMVSIPYQPSTQPYPHIV